MRYKSSSRGFTLIELLVVVVILAVLVAIAIPSYFGYVRASKRTEAKSNLQALSLLLEQRFAEHGQYCPALNTDYTYTEDNNGVVLTETIRTDFLVGFRPKLSVPGPVLYDYTIRSTAAITYVITASPAAVVRPSPAPAGVYTIDQNGAKTGNW
ncbi:MAG: hypothetical protein CVV37_08320 [Nitrospira bacterium HGW-Nitrospira-1]|nr:MAG: hypothetical protein CVV37_08320 [Nitrospira bacterium HGW-Nitrospira-1]